MADFFTNGVLLSENKISALIDMGLDQMTVSFSGATRQTYETIHRGATFDRTVRNLMEIKAIKRIKKSYRPLISLNFIAMNMNFHELPLLMRLAGKLDIFRIYVKPLVVYADKPFLSAEKRGYIPQRDDPILDLARNIGRLNGIQLRDNDYKTHLWPEASSSAISANEIHDGQGNEHPSMPKCHEPWRTFFICASGDVKPCCFYGGSAPMGNLDKSSAAQIWNGEAFLRLREQIRSGIIPSGCEHCVEFGLMPKVQSILKEVAAYGVKRFLPVTAGTYFHLRGNNR